MRMKEKKLNLVQDGSLIRTKQNDDTEIRQS